MTLNNIFQDLCFPLGKKAFAIKMRELNFDKLVQIDPGDESWTTMAREWLLDWHNRKRSGNENGLYFLLKT